jgi:hypothetical protein
MRQPITPAQFDWIHVDNSRGHDDQGQPPRQTGTWHGNMERAKAIYKHITGRTPRLGTCITCHLDLYNELRQAVNLPLLGRKVSEGMVEERKRICLSCPIFHEDHELRKAWTRCPEPYPCGWCRAVRVLSADQVAVQIRNLPR